MNQINMGPRVWQVLELAGTRPFITIPAIERHLEVGHGNAWAITDKLRHGRLLEEWQPISGQHRPTRYRLTFIGWDIYVAFQVAQPRRVVWKEQNGQVIPGSMVGMSGYQWDR